MEPGEVALVPVTFIEERRGAALVRLPNGSKTTVEYEALEALGARGHFVQAIQGPGGAVYCSECEWSSQFRRWPQGATDLAAHYKAAHG